MKDEMLIEELDTDNQSMIGGWDTDGGGRMGCSWDTVGIQDGRESERGWINQYSEISTSARYPVNPCQSQARLVHGLFVYTP